MRKYNGVNVDTVREVAGCGQDCASEFFREPNLRVFKIRHWLRGQEHQPEEELMVTDLEIVNLPAAVIEDRIVTRFKADHEYWRNGLLRPFDEEAERERLRPI